MQSHKYIFVHDKVAIYIFLHSSYIPEFTKRKAIHFKPTTNSIYRYLPTSTTNNFAKADADNTAPAIHHTDI